MLTDANKFNQILYRCKQILMRMQSPAPAAQTDNRIRIKTNFQLSFESFSLSLFLVSKMFEPNQASSAVQTVDRQNSALDIVCELTWPTRDYLIYSLNRYSQLLLGKALTVEARNEIAELNFELLSVLLGLPLSTQQDSGELNSQPPAENSLESNDVVLDLHWQTRTRLIDSLGTNHTLTVLHGRSVASDAKRSLVEQNTELVSVLLKLPARLVAEKRIAQIDAAIDSAEKPTLFEKCKKIYLRESANLSV